MTFKTQSRELGDRFWRRGYQDYIIETAYIGASRRDRGTLLTPQRKYKKQTELQIIGQYDMLSNKVRKILAKNWHILLWMKD